MARGLTDRQKKLCEAYIADPELNLSRAARKAGYSESWANGRSYQFLRRPHVQEYLAKLNKDRQRRTEISIDWVIVNLKKQYEEADTEGERNAALRALELIGKHLQMFTDKSSMELEIKNPFATGEDSEAISRDIDRLVRIAQLNKKNNEELDDDLPTEPSQIN